MNRLLHLGVCLLLCAPLFAQDPPKREMRGAWIATFSNIDWPTRTQTPAQQRSALIAILDHHKATGINTVYFQVRSQCDALYPSAIEPWSIDLNGQQGRAPSPLWDPLQFAIDECHKRGMELHAWINPYRAVATASQLTANPSPFTAAHVARQHPEWLLNNGSTITLNPGLAPVRDYILSVITDIVQRYDLDGIHFDDYFYPPAPFNDDAAYNADPRGIANRADWRRDNINLLIQRVYQTIASIKPWVKFGVSPSGIYRSSTNPAIGSNTSSGANQHYSSVYADSKRWLQEGWVDYIEPQVYWYIGQTGSDYAVLVPWWNNNAFGRHIYIGMAGYKVNDANSGQPWLNPSMIPNEMRLNRSQPNIYGQAIYNTSSLRATTRLGFRDSLRLFFYNRLALQPTMPWRDATPPAAPSLLTVQRYANDSVVLHWNHPPDGSSEMDKVKRFVVYRSTDPSLDLSKADNILAITLNDTTAYRDASILPNTTYYYTITALDRLQNESAAGPVLADQPPTLQCLPNTQLDLNAACAALVSDYRSSANAQHASTVTQSPAPGTTLGSGLHTVTITATNAVGQAATCSFELDVADRTAPVLTPLHPEAVNGSTHVFSTDPGLCQHTLGNELDLVASDNCPEGLSQTYTLTHYGMTGSAVSATSLSGLVFSKGLTTVNWLVTDAAGNTAGWQFTVQVNDTEDPVLAAPAPLTLFTDAGLCSAQSALVPPAASDNCGTVSLTATRSDNKPMNAPFAKGITNVTWTARDVDGHAVSAVQTITVEDHEPPVITNFSADPSLLFPPNHKMRKITLSYSVSDNCGPVQLSLSVSSNEPQNGTGDGDTHTDWEILDNRHVRLRAERSGDGNGRIYTLTLTATDASGNTSSAQTTVLVPHDHSDVTQNRSAAADKENGERVTVLPNPSSGAFTVKLNVSGHQYSYRVLDNTGRLIEARSNASAPLLHLGQNWKPGMYFLEIVAEGEKRVIKLEKM